MPSVQAAGLAATAPQFRAVLTAAKQHRPAQATLGLGPSTTSSLSLLAFNVTILPMGSSEAFMSFNSSRMYSFVCAFEFSRVGRLHCCILHLAGALDALCLGS